MKFKNKNKNKTYFGIENRNVYEMEKMSERKLRRWWSCE